MIDVDNEEAFKNLEMYTSDKNYFVTSFDNYSLKKGLEIVGKSRKKEKVLMTKILYAKNIKKTDEEYLDFLSFNYAVKWSNGKIYFPFDNGDATIIIENQRSARISYIELSQEYKEGITNIVNQIAPEISTTDIKKILKNV